MHIRDTRLRRRDAIAVQDIHFGASVAQWLETRHVIGPAVAEDEFSSIPHLRCRRYSLSAMSKKSSSPLADLPSVDSLLQTDSAAAMTAEFGRAPATDAIRCTLDDIRTVVLAGGMGTGRQLVACLSLGAEGMLIATRMVVAQEIWAHENYKKRLAELGPDGTKIIMSIFGDNSRVIDNPSTEAVLALEAEGSTDYEAYRPHVQGNLQKEAYEDGDWTKGTMSIGQSVAFAGDIRPAEQIIDGIVEEATAARDRLNGF